MTAAIEKQIIASLLEYQDKIESFSFSVKPYHFSKQVREIYSKILELHAEDKTITPQLLLEYIPKESQEILLDIQTCNPIADFMGFIPEIERRFKLNQQRAVAAKLLKGYDEGEVIDITTIQASLQESPKDFKNLHHWAEAIEAMPLLMRYKTGVSFLDYCFGGGFEPSQLILLSGEPEAGKTSLGLQILENVAQTNQVCFFCFEFTARQYVSRKLEQNAKFIENAGKNLFLINDGYDISQISDNIKHLARTGVKFFLIDSQMRIEVPKARSMEEEESTKFSTLAKLAHKLEIIIILIIQTAKGDSNNPMGSKKGGHESSITIRIEHCKPDKNDSANINREFDPKRRTIIIKKNKQTGKHFKEEVQFDPIRMIFKRDDIRSKDKPVEFTPI